MAENLDSDFELIDDEFEFVDETSSLPSFDSYRQMMKRSGTAELAKTGVEIVEKYAPVAKAVAPIAYENTPWGMAHKAMRKGEAMSREGLEQLASYVPEPNVSSEQMRPYADVMRHVVGGPSPETMATMANFVGRLPKAAAEVTAKTAPFFISPEALALEGAGGVAVAAIASKPVQAVGKAVVKATPEPVKRALTYRFGQPETYKVLAEGSKQAQYEKAQEAVELARPLFSFSKEEQIAAGRYLKGEIEDVPEHIKAAAEPVRNAFKQLGKDSVDLGLLDEATYAANVDTYLPRLYRKHELGVKEQKFPAQAARINLDRFKKRTDIPEDVRGAMGEILEAGYPTAKGLYQLSQSVERAKMFKAVAENSQWVAKTAQEAAEQGFIQLPKARSLGPLSEKFVHPEIARDINQIVRVPSTREKLWNSFISKWKFGKVIANPATHFRNLLSNSILMSLGGVSHLEQPRYLMQAIGEMTQGGRFFSEAKQAGLLGREFFGGEIRQFASTLRDELANPDILSRAAGMASRAGNKLGKIYQAEEQVFKLGKFIHNRTKLGMSIEAAKADAEKWLFNYEKVPPIVDYLRKSPLGAPFITFASKAIPRVAETAVTNPLKLMSYYVAFDAMEQLGLDKGVYTTQELDTIKRNARGQIVVLPFRDDGGVYTLDLSYILPWGDIGEQGGLFGLPPVAPPTGPLKAAVEAGLNKSAFTGRDIYNPNTDTVPERAAKVTDFLSKAMLPSLTPGVPTHRSPFKGGYSFNKLYSAATNKPDYLGRVKPLPVATLDALFGLKFNPYDPVEIRAREARKDQYISASLQGELARVQRHKGINKKEKKDEIRRFNEKIKKLFEPEKPYVSPPDRLRFGGEENDFEFVDDNEDNFEFVE